MSNKIPFTVEVRSGGELLFSLEVCPDRSAPLPCYPGGEVFQIANLPDPPPTAETWQSIRAVLGYAADFADVKLAETRVPEASVAFAAGVYWVAKHCEPSRYRPAREVFSIVRIEGSAPFLAIETLHTFGKGIDRFVVNVADLISGRARVVSPIEVPSGEELGRIPEVPPLR